MTEILITSSVLIAVLLVLRKVFRNILSRRVQYALWGLVLVRLLIPVSLPAVDFSVLTAARPVQQTVTRTITAQPVYVPVARAPLAEHPIALDVSPERTEISEGESVWVLQSDETAVQYKRLSARTVLTYAWLAGSGAAAMFLLAVTTMAAGKKQLKDRFTRIAQKPRQLAAAAVAVALLAGLVSACTFTGAKTPGVTLPSETPQEDAGLQALTGAELRYFNESFFNGAGFRDEYGNGFYTIRNQFANPMNMYEKPEDIDLYELFYCEGVEMYEGEELKAVYGMDELPGVPAFKMTVDEINRILLQYTGLTLEQTNRVGMDTLDYSPDYGAYYWMHGDTNYPGDLYFPVGTREGSAIKLYQDSSFYPNGWFCVTLEAQEDGGYWFVSNQPCERPNIPTPMPADPEVVIPLDGLEPYEAPAVTLTARTGDFKDTYENRLANWNIDGHNVLLYRDTEGIFNAAVREGDTMNVFLTELGVDAGMFFYKSLFGHDGFVVSYYGQISEKPSIWGMCENYYYFDEDGALHLLAHIGKNYNGPTAMDLDGDGTDELASGMVLFFQRDGQICRADLYDLVLSNCPALDNWYGAEWDIYAKSLFINGSGANEVTGFRDVHRWLYFDGENDRLLLFKDTRTCHDHLIDGIGEYVPEEVISAAKDYVEREIVVAQPDGTWRHRGYEDEGYSQETYDDWRIENVSSAYTTTVGDITVECWYFNYEMHTTTPEKVVLAGGKYMTEDDWVSPGYPNCDWLFFRVEGDARTLIWKGMANDIIPGSEMFDTHLNYVLEQSGLVS